VASAPVTRAVLPRQAPEAAALPGATSHMRPGDACPMFPSYLLPYSSKHC